MALAVAATFFAAGRPAHAITRVPVVVALSGRPAPPKQIHRSAVPGIVVLVVAFLLFGASGAAGNGGGASAAGARLRGADRRNRPAGAVLPGGAGRRGQQGSRHGAPGVPRPGPLPGPLRFRPGRDRSGNRHRRHDLRRCASALQQRPRLRRAEPGLGPARPLHATSRPTGHRLHPPGRGSDARRSADAEPAGHVPSGARDRDVARDERRHRARVARCEL